MISFQNVGKCLFFWRDCQLFWQITNGLSVCPTHTQISRSLLSAMSALAISTAHDLPISLTLPPTAISEVVRSKIEPLSSTKNYFWV